MTIFLHELKRNKLSLIIWSFALSFMLAVCILVYPEMSSQMGEMNEMLANMGDFSAAFGMDNVNFGDFSGYFAIEFGNSLGLGGAIFAAIIGISALAKEEKDKTAEFLLTHPIKRSYVVFSKYFASIAQIFILNITTALIIAISILGIGETLELKSFLLLFVAYLIMQLEIASVCFGISSFIRGNGLGIGTGIAIGLYFINIVSNLVKELDFLKFISPFGYADSTTIVSKGTVDWEYLVFGLVLTFLGVLLSYLHYSKKEIL